ncbi:hypothetical protein [Dyadobacter sp. CY312]|uniref:hypothetical protein n=1 Tax=Dyadobacter sp. CY312 TaxID=2907303 RepID=UPI001F31629D|nr:hypothetical protein [Dyadobacter sp. CY312]MCE7038731.1 hypothetical protein [Dyadobacter sp. CY312]
MKQALFAILLASGIMGCETLGLKDEKWTHQVKDVKNNDYFTIDNKGPAASVTFNIEGELSHDARILWYYEEPDADTTFARAEEILLPKGKVTIGGLQKDYYSNKLYVKYESLNDSTSGNLQIKITI